MKYLSAAPEDGEEIMSKAAQRLQGSCVSLARENVRFY